MVMVRNPKPYKWFIYGYGLVGQNIRPCTPLITTHQLGLRATYTSLKALKEGHLCTLPHRSTDQFISNRLLHYTAHTNLLVYKNVALPPHPCTNYNHHLPTFTRFLQLDYIMI